MLRPVHRWVWRDFDRRVRKLLAFAEVEGDGGRDILRAPTPRTRSTRFTEHAITAPLRRSAHAAQLQLRLTVPRHCSTRALPGGHGLDDWPSKENPTIVCSPSTYGKAAPAASRFIAMSWGRSADARSRRDPPHEVFHMNHAHNSPAPPKSYRRQVAGASRLWEEAFAGGRGKRLAPHLTIMASFCWRLVVGQTRRTPRAGWLDSHPQEDKDRRRASSGASS
jgi:hypothetical protein